MTLKREKAWEVSGRTSSRPPASADEWLEMKRKLDGAEGLWRIGDKLYDFTLWARTHPGGRFWLEATRGTDITEAFETHHLTDEPESLLGKFYQRGAQTRRSSSVTFAESGFHRVFKRKLLRQDVTRRNQFLVKMDALAAAVFLTALAGAHRGVSWTMASGVLLGLLSTASHRLLHAKDNWRLSYFNLSLMSFREWRVKHVLSHHQFRNSDLDLEVSTWHPLRFILKGERCLVKFLRLTFTPFLFAIAAHVQFSNRVLEVFLSRKLRFHSEELAGFTLPLFLFLFGEGRPWGVLLDWTLIVMIGSFTFSLLSSPLLRRLPLTRRNRTRRDGEDFGLVQISLLSHPTENLSVTSSLNSFRGNVLHYLCPTLDGENLHRIVPIFEETSDEFGVTHKRKEPDFFEGHEDWLPEGHVFFS